jgi:cytochrome c oxidase subunit II
VRRGSILQLVGIGLVAGGIAAAVALFIPWLPEPASREAGRIHFVFWFATVICIAIFALVASVIVYSVLRFRAAPDDEDDGPPIHGHTGLEIVWTAVPTALVTAIAIVSGIVLAKDDAAGSNPLRVNVTAQQFAWTFSYPGTKVANVGTLHLPVGRSVVLHLEARDVLHSFWVPEFSQKQDAVPGHPTTVHITPTRVGTYPVICTELCGLGHAYMRTSVTVMRPDAFRRWLQGGGGQAQGQQAQAGGQAQNATFQSQGCGSCHTLKAAGATGKIGPDLDNLVADARKAGKPLEAYVHESIVDPNAYVVPGYGQGVMPTTYGTGIPKADLDALVQYLVTSARKGS